MTQPQITVRGAREHNLRNIDLTLPRNQLICFTGVSGSGKSSMAFDTLYAEGQRRYVESLSTFARQYLGQLPKPDVDFVGGLSPSISISQKATGHNPRSTVGTITEIYDFLRVLYARVGAGHCPHCRVPITAQTREQIVGRIIHRTGEEPLLILAPLVRQQKGAFREAFEDLRRQGFARARVDGAVIRLDNPPTLDRQRRHDIEVVIDRLAEGPRDRGRLFEAVDQGLRVGSGSLIALRALKRGPTESPAEEKEPRTKPGDDDLWSHAESLLFSSSYSCPQCGVSFPPPSPQLFSFNSPQGMCLSCDGLGRLHTFAPQKLIPDPRLSVQQGAMELLGRQQDWSRYLRHILQGVAATLEHLLELKPGTMLETPWADLSAELQQAWLYGTGERTITFTWRGGAKPIKYGGKFVGVIPDLLAKYRATKQKSKLEQYHQYMDLLTCPDCRGQRLNPQARAVTLRSTSGHFAANPQRSLPEACELSIDEAAEFFATLELSETEQFIAGEALKEIRQRLRFLQNVGLSYLSLGRTAPTLSGGETQRIRLASQVGSGLVGVLYVLDEPSIGLHPRDNERLIQTLLQLRDAGNTLVVVEHDEETMLAADLIVDFGPGPGIHGGKIVGLGPARELAEEPKSLTGRYLNGDERIEIPTERRRPSDKYLTVRGAQQNNLREIDVRIPLGLLVGITGVSGSGKSSLVGDILEPALRVALMGGEGEIGLHQSIEGLEYLDKAIAIDQSPIGRTPRSNPATYVKVFDEIRDLFAQLPLAKQRGYAPGRFSFNVDGGRCSACEGNGATRLDMDFLADVWVTCPVCEGRRYNRETLEVHFKGHSIADVLAMNIDQAAALFANIPKINQQLQTLNAVGLSYLQLGQPSPTLSGGEAQRIKLSRELSKRATGRTVYLLDEPTTGLHFADIKLLLKVLHDLVARGNTVIVVEHNLDVIKTADWLIDLGPEGGAGGGRIVAEGSPEQVAAAADSHTGRALSRILRGEPPIRWLKQSAAPATSTSRTAKKPLSEPKPGKAAGEQSREIVIEGAAQHNLKSIDLRVPRDQMSVFCGPSGSGKSSLAMDTIYAEGQRRYVESLSAYARQFIGQLQKPKVERIEGLSPAIALEQKNLGHTPRSTVGTVTEIYDYLRVLLARLGEPYCPTCQQPVGTQTVDQIVDKILLLPEGTRALLLAPRAVETGIDYGALWQRLQADGFQRVRVNGTTHAIDAVPALDPRTRHLVQIVVDRLTVRPASRSRIAESVELALSLGAGVCQLAIGNADLPEPRWEQITHSQHLACGICGRSFEPLTPHHFSFNTSAGWCPQCEGLGTQTGTNPAALIRNPNATLLDGALELWPPLNQPLGRALLRAVSRYTQLPLDVPYNELNARHRRILFHGLGDQWLDVRADDYDSRSSGPASYRPFRFLFRGFYPALEAAARMSQSLRGRLANFVSEIDCSACDGTRLREEAAAVRLFDLTVGDLVQLPLYRLSKIVRGWKLDSRGRKIGGELLRGMRQRLDFLSDVGLDYLTLGRGAATLSGGEAQRIRLAAQLGSGLCGVLYVLDEPTVGLHPRDNQRLLSALHKLRDAGNTLLVVEHDREVIAGCDRLYDFGPGAGRQGGRIVSQGTPAEVAKDQASLTGNYLSQTRSIPVPITRRMIPAAQVAPPAKGRGSKSERKPKSAVNGNLNWYPPGAGWLTIRGACENNLRQVDASIPLGALVAITGPSGSGKSSLIDDCLYPALAHRLHRATMKVGRHNGIEGLGFVDKVIRVDQSPLGNTPHSNPATYSGAFELIRQLFAQLPEAKRRGFTARQFSFNVPGGRCESCEGSGQRRIEMHFLPDVWITCESCQGRRYTSETLEVKFHGHSIHDCLELPCSEAAQLFQHQPRIHRIIKTLCDVGLDYVTLGQAAPTLSGGEAQRVKLASELARPDTGRTLYLLDEPTTGLHFDDIAKLLQVLHRLVELGNTVVVVEHNLDVLKQADWIIDLGPEAGAAGGQIVVAGTPEDVVAYAASRQQSACPSHTGAALRSVLEGSPRIDRDQWLATPIDRPQEDSRTTTMTAPSDTIQEVAAPWESDGRRWHMETRLDRTGKPVHWPAEMLQRLVERLEKVERLPPIKWEHRSVIEVPLPAGQGSGWFMHAFTAEPWWLKLKFRVPRGTFNRQSLASAVPLKTLNELPDVPRFSNEQRITTRIAAGGFQEIEWRLVEFAEMNVPGFWEFLDTAIDAICGQARAKRKRESTSNAVEQVRLKIQQIVDRQPRRKT